MSEDHRSRCEVRAILAMRAAGGRRHADYLELVEKRRGADIAHALRGHCIEQWNRGNRGDWGVWIEKIEGR
jgi:hypothetical protein